MNLHRNADDEALASLLDKYRRLVRLREEREVLENEGILKLKGEKRAQRKKRLLWLSENHPGSLRELELSKIQLIERLHATEHFIAQQNPNLSDEMRSRQGWPFWMESIQDFHQMMLIVSRVRGQSAKKLSWAFWRQHDEPGSPLKLDSEYEFSTLFFPSSRRLSDGVLTMLAQGYRCSKTVLKEALFRRNIVSIDHTV